MSPRITTVTIAGRVPVLVDADRAWSEFKASPFEEQVAEIATCFFWQIQLPWIDLSEDGRQCFWDEFSKNEAVEARTVAVHGIRFSNNIDRLKLLNDAINFQRNLNAGRFKEDNADNFQSGAISIGLRFAELAEKKDHRAFQAFADIFKTGGIEGGNRGGEDSFHGQVIRDFCQLVLTGRTLPTKKLLRESLGLSSEKPDAENLRVALKSLGLSGLPLAR